ncbi:hypothetical protein DFH08DRAFT_890085 [Mycena albidolilacea]|uniref:Uncharacterized protein n=1 Tax=Mycena albidolilacea TaxID=1033008 RepID=A0AAD6ZFE5_9AGAR|nr:hypothetical protein DFH08DRAFT_890085 [Mycena albidolilacea]
MKPYCALLIFVQLAGSWAAASPVARHWDPLVKRPAGESDKARRSPGTPPKHPPFVHYPGSEEANNAPRSPLVHVPFIHYAGGDVENDESDEKDRKEPCGRDTSHTEYKPFVHHPAEK